MVRSKLGKARSPKPLEAWYCLNNHACSCGRCASIRAAVEERTTMKESLESFRSEYEYLQRLLARLEAELNKNVSGV